MVFLCVWLRLLAEQMIKNCTAIVLVTHLCKLDTLVKPVVWVDALLF
eukprot:SAG31_NODE_2426_length_5721_cov_11.664176_3_plen_47_part_00